MEASDYVCTLCLAVLFILVSVGVNILIRVSTIKSSYDTLLQEGDYTKKEKRAKKKTETFTGAYWCLEQLFILVGAYGQNNGISPILSGLLLPSYMQPCMEL